MLGELAMGVWITGVCTADPGWYGSVMGDELYTVGAMVGWLCDLVGVTYPRAACGSVGSAAVAYVADEGTIMLEVTGTGAGWGCCCWATDTAVACGYTVDMALTPKAKGGSDTCDGAMALVGVYAMDTGVGTTAFVLIVKLGTGRRWSPVAKGAGRGKPDEGIDAEYWPWPCAGRFAGGSVRSSSMLLFRPFPYAIAGLFESGDKVDTQFCPLACIPGPGEYAVGVVGARLCPLAVGEAFGDRYMA